MNRTNITTLAGVALLAVGYWLYGLWTRPPVVEHDNLRYIQLLRTAVSAKNPTWLAGVEKAINHRREENAISPAEERHFRRILDQAKSGDWANADRACFEFEQAQLNRRRTPVNTEHRHHDHTDKLRGESGKSRRSGLQASNSMADETVNPRIAQRTSEGRLPAGNRSSH